ncbi:PQQ-binding-like beta-propeller repeat protein [Halomicroarcula limicola]|uniref:PQQ-binding-like beta-propeller repeat protein n=1 Tax=Haloarcula limicola TaxID=1429915 RepID=A0A8J7Y8S4_9EURY|nr:PQQ-binding-like beta-propeller repeat protein [Halomicroarcula limicola]MBV0923344.1 PQQ-binding-like beta-propeller repeat protein [Halomicroarcula limicola]
MPSRRSFLASAGVATIAGVAGCQTDSGYDDAADAAGDDTDWPTTGHDRQHTRYVPAGSGPRSGVTERWRVASGLVTAEPVVVGDTVLATVGSDMVALDAESGEKRWSADPENQGASYWAAPSVYDGTAYVTGDGRARAFDIESGEQQWSREFESPTAGSTVGYEGSGLFVAAGETVYRLDRETGEIAWQRRLFGQIRQPVAVRPPFVVAVTEGGDVYALDESDGDGYWRTGLPDAVQCTPTMAGRRIFVGCFDGNLYALGHRGQREWRTEIGGFAKGGIGVADGAVYADGGRELHAVGVESGDRRWRVDLGTTGDHAPVIVGDTVYVGGDRLRALRPGGGVGVGDVRVEAARFTATIGRYVGQLSAANGSLYAHVTEETAEGKRNVLVRLDPE